MSRIEIRQTVEVYEINGEETGFRAQRLAISSHEDNEDLVVLQFGRKKITVTGSDLMKAVENAMNSGE